MRRFGAAFFTFCFVLMMFMSLSSGVTAATWSGSGTKANPYKINDVADLAALAAAVNGGDVYADTYFSLTADLDLSDQYGENGSVQQGWTPIGNDGTPSPSFQGHFLGDHHRIAGLYQSGLSCGGLFGFCKNSVIENLTVSGEILAGQGSAGGIVGYSEGSRISGCAYRGTVTGENHVGGIVGLSKNDRLIEDCTVTGKISAADGKAGGIVGEALLDSEAGGDLILDGCVNRAAVGGGSGGAVGGIAGSLQDQSKQVKNTDELKVRNCVNYGTVLSGGSGAGGIAGAVTGYDVLIANCFNCGKVAFYGDDPSGAEGFGGIAGSLRQQDADISLTVTNCVNNGAVSERAASFGAIAGKIGGKSQVRHNYWGKDCALTMEVGTKEGSTAAVDHNYRYGSAPLTQSKDVVDNLNDWVDDHNDWGCDTYQKWIDLKMELTNVISDTKDGVQLVTGPIGLTAMNPMTVKVKIDGKDKTTEVYTAGGETAAPYRGDVATKKKGESWLITAGATAATFDVNHRLTRLTAAAGTAGAGIASFAHDYTTTLTADSGHLLPDAIEVTIGGVEAPAGAYRYDKTSGEVTVYGAYITGDIDLGAISYVGYFYLLGQKIGLPEGDEVIYGNVNALHGSTAHLSDASFTALTAGTDYTWWITYDSAGATWQLRLDGFLMSKPYQGGNVVACYEDQPFAIAVNGSTLLGNADDSCIVYTAGVQKLTVKDSTLVQSSTYGHIAAGDQDLSAAVTDSTLTALNSEKNSGGDVFIINYTDGSNASVLSVTFAGENNVSAYYDLLYYFEENENSSAALNIEDDFSFLSYGDEAVESMGDVSVKVADGAALTLKMADGLNEYYSAIASWHGDVSISGGELTLCGTKNAITAPEGSLTLSDCAMEATGGQGYGAFFAAKGLTLNHIGVISPEKGSVASLTTTLYYRDDDNDDDIDYGEVCYAKYVEAGHEEVYYDCVKEGALTKTDFDAAIAASGIKAAPGFDAYNVSDNGRSVAYAQLGLVYQTDGYYVKSGEAYTALAAAVEVPYGTDETAAKAALPAAAYVKLLSIAGKTVYEPVNLTWSIKDYQGKVPASYDAEATAAYAKSEAHYPGALTLDAVNGKVTVLAANHQCVHYVDRESWPSWAKESVCFVIENKLMIGMSADPLTFNTTSSVNRGMVVQILYNLAGKPEVTSDDIAAYNHKFRDVAADAWYYNALVWAANHQIAKGIASDVFSADTPVTREQMVTFLWRYQGSPETGGKLDAFPDQNKVSDYAKTAFCWAVEKDIVNGMAYEGAALLSPETSCTRGQVAVIIAHYAQVCMSDHAWINLTVQ